MAFRSKVIIRRLPPTFDGPRLEVLLAPWRAHINYVAIHPGKVPPLASGKSFRHAKAIVNFADPSILLDFVQNLASSPWVDERGAEHQLLVEFAAYQAIPSPTTVSDPLCGTLEEDDHYQKFLQDLQTTEQQPNSVSLEEQLEGLLLREKELFPWKYDKNYVRSTALLEHLKGTRSSSLSKHHASSLAAKQGEDDKAKKNKKKKKRKKPKSHETPSEAVGKPSKEKHVPIEAAAPLKPAAFKILPKPRRSEEAPKSVQKQATTEPAGDPPQKAPLVREAKPSRGSSRDTSAKVGPTRGPSEKPPPTHSLDPMAKTYEPATETHGTPVAKPPTKPVRKFTTSSQSHSHTQRTKRADNVDPPANPSKGGNANVYSRRPRPTTT